MIGMVAFMRLITKLGVGFLEKKSPYTWTHWGKGLLLWQNWQSFHLGLWLLKWKWRHLSHHLHEWLLQVTSCRLRCWPCSSLWESVRDHQEEGGRKEWVLLYTARYRKWCEKEATRFNNSIVNEGDNSSCSACNTCIKQWVKENRVFKWLISIPSRKD